MIDGPADIARVGAYLILVGVLLVSCTKGMSKLEWLMFILELLFAGAIVLFWNYQ